MAVLALKQLYYNPDNSTDFHSMYRVRLGKTISETVHKELVLNPMNPKTLLLPVSAYFAQT